LIKINKPSHIASYFFGKPVALIKAAEDDGLIESIDKHIGHKKIDGKPSSQYLLTIIIGRSEHIHGREALEYYSNFLIMKRFLSHSFPSQGPEGSE